jgi:hypothetical protein
MLVSTFPSTCVDAVVLISSTDHDRLSNHVRLEAGVPWHTVQGPAAAVHNLAAAHAE